MTGETGADSVLACTMASFALLRSDVFPYAVFPCLHPVHPPSPFLVGMVKVRASPKPQ